MNNKELYERYQRQIILKEFGVSGQEKLQRSRILVVGAGGLGCPALQYLAAAGIGTIGIVDDDEVSISNLHRQILYGTDDIGKSKALSAAAKLRQLNDEINIVTHTSRLTNINALQIIGDYDVVIDGTDNFSSRYMINDACVLMNKPLIYGAISGFEGQVAIFNSTNASTARTSNYRDLFAVPPAENEALNCAESGVLGILPGLIGTVQASETIKLITGIGECLTNKILTYNALNNSVYTFNILLNDEAQKLIPKSKEAFLQMDYDWLCSSKTNQNFEIDVVEFNKLIDEKDTLIIDVREPNELPLTNEFENVQIPLNSLVTKQDLIMHEKIVLFCTTGKRSAQAAILLQNIFGTSKKIYSLRGGIVEWKKKNLLKSD